MNKENNKLIFENLVSQIKGDKNIVKQESEEKNSVINEDIFSINIEDIKDLKIITNYKKDKDYIRWDVRLKLSLLVLSVCIMAQIGLTVGAMSLLGMFLINILSVSIGSISLKEMEMIKKKYEQERLK